MAMSRRAKRMERKHKKNQRVALNLVSLMDIFTILVFFLLVNSGDVDELPNDRSISMPESTAVEKARETVVVLVTRDNILIQGRPVISVADAMSADAMVLAPLKDALVAHSRNVIVVADPTEREVTIMGDKSVPYRLLKKVLATCADADYAKVSMAVVQKAGNTETNI